MHRSFISRKNKKCNIKILKIYLGRGWDALGFVFFFQSLELWTAVIVSSRSQVS